MNDGNSKPGSCAMRRGSRWTIGTVACFCLLACWPAGSGAQPFGPPLLITDYVRNLFRSDDANDLRPQLSLGVINVKDYPYLAKGDGVTDDTAAIQAAIDGAYAAYVADTSKTFPEVYFPPGTYMVSNLTLTAPCTLRGSAWKFPVLKMISGSTGNMIEDNGNAQGVVITNLCINGNGCTANGIVLGYNTYQHGGGGFLRDLVIRDFDGDESITGIGLWVNGNAVTYWNIDIASNDTDNCNIMVVNGAGNQFFGVVNMSVAAYGIKDLGLGNVWHGLHIEGTYTSGAVLVDGDNNYYSGTTVTVGSTDTLPAAFVVAAGEYGNVFSGLSIYLEAGGACTTGIIDNSYATPLRSVAPRNGVGTNNLIIDHYRNGREPCVVPATVTTGPPTTGTWRQGDIAYLREATYGEPTGYLCVSSGTPGSWSAISTAAAAVAKTTDYPVTAADTGTRFSNSGAAGSVTFTLPADAANLEFEFIKTADYPFLIDPSDGTDHFQGMAAGVALSLGSVGDVVRIGRYASNTWYVLRGNVLTTPLTANGVVTKNGSTSAGYVDIYEDSDNGTNRARLIGPASTADVEITLPAVTGTVGVWLSGSATWDPAELADGAGETSASITVTGAAVGDFALVSAPYDLQGILATAYVDATNSVKVRLQNETTGTINLGSGTWRVRVMKQ